MDDETRQLLKPFILRVIGNLDPAAKAARVRHIVLETIRRVIPLAFNTWSPEHAKAFQAIPDNASYNAMETTVGKIFSTVPHQLSLTSRLAQATSVAIDAARDATPFMAVTAAAAVTDYAVRIAAEDANATVWRSTSADQTTADPDVWKEAAAARSAAATAVWREAINILDGTLRIGKQAPEFDEETVLAAVRRFEAARLEMPTDELTIQKPFQPRRVVPIPPDTPVWKLVPF